MIRDREVATMHKAFFEFRVENASNHNPEIGWMEVGYPREWRDETSIHAVQMKLILTGWGYCWIVVYVW